MVTGLTLMTDGHGFRTRISAGPLITMAAGRIFRIMAGSGFPETIWTGDQHGSRGGPAVIMSAGRLCRHVAQALFMREGPLALRWTSSSISVQSITTFARFATS